MLNILKIQYGFLCTKLIEIIYLIILILIQVF